MEAKYTQLTTVGIIQPETCPRPLRPGARIGGDGDERVVKAYSDYTPKELCVRFLGDVLGINTSDIVPDTGSAFTMETVKQAWVANKNKPEPEQTRLRHIVFGMDKMDTRTQLYGAFLSSAEGDNKALYAMIKAAVKGFFKLACVYGKAGNVGRGCDRVYNITLA